VYIFVESHHLLSNKNKYIWFIKFFFFNFYILYIVLYIEMSDDDTGYITAVDGVISDIKDIQVIILGIPPAVPPGTPGTPGTTGGVPAPVAGTPPANSNSNPNSNSNSDSESSEFDWVTLGVVVLCTIGLGLGLFLAVTQAPPINYVGFGIIFACAVVLIVYFLVVPNIGSTESFRLVEHMNSNDDSDIATIRAQLEQYDVSEDHIQEKINELNKIKTKNRGTPPTRGSDISEIKDKVNTIRKEIQEKKQLIRKLVNEINLLTTGNANSNSNGLTNSNVSELLSEWDSNSDGSLSRDELLRYVDVLHLECLILFEGMISLDIEKKVVETPQPA